MEEVLLPQKHIPSPSHLPAQPPPAPAGNKHMLGEILKLYVKLCGKRMDKIEGKSGLISQWWHSSGWSPLPSMTMVLRWLLRLWWVRHGRAPGPAQNSGWRLIRWEFTWWQTLCLRRQADGWPMFRDLCRPQRWWGGVGRDASIAQTRTGSGGNTLRGQGRGLAGTRGPGGRGDRTAGALPGV